MPREAPSPPEWKPLSDGVETLNLHLKLITPMFGGGYEPRNVDEVIYIRPAAIRGHLRFWWRALYGGAYAEPRDLFKAEEDLWGSADKPGKVRLKVEVTNSGIEAPYDKVAPGVSRQEGPREGFFLFPFQEQRKQGLLAATGRKEVEFSLCVECRGDSACCKQVKRTLKAWIAFGGVGSRTRRGCGSLTVTKDEKEWLPPSNEDGLRKWLNALAADAGSGMSSGQPGLSVLGGATVVLASETDPGAAWRSLGKFWAAFRKGHVGKGHVGSEPYEPTGACRWRDYHILKAARGKNKQGLGLNKPYLGLPIIYQRFAPRPGEKEFYAPTIEPEGSGRMASPVILKPLAVVGSKARPMVAILRAPMPRGVRIDGQSTSIHSNANDPVLQGLKVEHPLDAVAPAAIGHFGGNSTIVISNLGSGGAS